MLLAHPDLAEPLLVDPADGRLRDPRTLGHTATRRCCHQIAARVLNRIGERADRVGQLVWALRAAELRLALPSTRRPASACSSTCGACARA